MPDYFPLNFLQSKIVDKLAADSWFNRIPVIAEDIGDIVTAVDISVGKLGSCVVVETPVANCNIPNVPSIIFDEVLIVVTVWENVIINRDPNSAEASQKPALHTAQIVAALLHHWVPELEDGSKEAIVTIRSPSITLAENPDLLGYHVYFDFGGGLTYTPSSGLRTGSNQTLLTGLGLGLKIGSMQ
jgi:hypothetical protein